MQVLTSKSVLVGAMVCGCGRSLSMGPVVGKGLEQHWEYGDAVKEVEDQVDVHIESNEYLKEGIAVLKDYASEARYAQIVQVAKSRTKNIAIGYERPSNPNNVFACLRTIDAFGIQRVDYVSDSKAAASTRAKRRRAKATSFEERQAKMKSALGAQKWLSLKQHENTLNMYQSLKADGYQIIATDLKAGAKPFVQEEAARLFYGGSSTRSEDLKGETGVIKKKTAIIFGNEEVGISEELREMADHRLYIPMRGFAESFNLSVATAAFLSRLDAFGLLHSPSSCLTEEEQDELILRWLVKSVGHKTASALLRRHLPPEEVSLFIV